MRYLLFFLLLVPALCSAYDSDSRDWVFRTGLKTTYLEYNATQIKQNLTKIGTDLSADYLERGGVSAGVGFTRLILTENPSLDSVVDETTVSGNGWIRSYPDWLSGALTWELSVYYNRSKYQSTETIVIQNQGQGQGNSQNSSTSVIESSKIGNGWTLSPMLSYLNFKRTFYLDTGVAYSHYTDEDESVVLETFQLAPTVGVGFFKGREWIQIRGYFSSIAKIDELNYVGQEGKYMHWFKPRSYVPEKFILRIFQGGQQYLVDNDGDLVYTSSDKRNRAYAVGLVWSHKIVFYIEGGYEEYTNLDSQDDYSGVYIHLNLTRQW